MSSDSANNQDNSIRSYYTNELFDFHLSGDGSGSKTGRMKNAAQAAEQASDSPKGKMVKDAGAAMSLVGEVMGLGMQASEALFLPMMAAMKGLQGIASLAMAKHLDPILGVDLHNVVFPPVPAPVPLPHPHIAMVFDPKDWVMCAVMSAVAMAAPPGPDPTAEQADQDDAAAVNLAFNAAVMVGSIGLGMLGLNATVKTGGMTPRGSCGAIGEVVPHFPLGPSWHPGFAAAVDKNNSRLFMGSLFVCADFEPLAGLMHPCNICWDVGGLDLARKKSKPKPRQLFLPTGFVTAIPWNNVIVNPIPTPINPQAILNKLLGAGFKKLKNSKGYKKAAVGFQNKLGAILKKLGMSSKRIAAIQKKICRVIGHPVDVASGELFTDEEDFSLPGPISLSWERTWYSRSDYEGPLGYGWHHSYDMALVVDKAANMAAFRMEDGRLATFELPSQPDKPVFNRKEKLHLHLHEEGFYFITDDSDLIYRFTDRKYAPHRKDQEAQLLQSISNRNGFAIRFDYDDRGWLTSIIDSAGRRLEVSNDRKGRITEITAPHPDHHNETISIARYEYDDLGNMVRQTNALGDKMEFTYAHHLLTEETWRNGSKWYFRWDGTETGAKCIETWGDGNLYHYQIEYQEGVTHAVNGEGVRTSYFHRNGLVYKEVDGNGHNWEKQYNRFNELELERDPLGNETVYAHDEKGNVVTINDPAGGFEHREYYHPVFPHALTEAMDVNGGKWQFDYDPAGNLVRRKNPMGAVLKISYEEGLPTKIEDEAGGVTHLDFDADFNLHEITEPLGAKWGYRYDHLGRCIQEVNPNQAKRQLKFDDIGRVKEVKDYDGNHIRLEYDGIDNILRYKDSQKDVRYTYKGLWKMTSRTEAGHTLRFTYNSEEQLTRIVNEQGLPYRFHLDSEGNVLREIGFDGLTREYNRNAAGWVSEVKRPSGMMTQYSHDAVGRVTEVRYHTGEQETYEYFPSGLLKSAINPSAKVEFKRDKLGNVVEESCNGEAVNSRYDNAGRRTGLTSSLGADIQYDLDIVGNTTKMQAKHGQGKWQADLRYDTLGMEIERMLPGGLSSRWKRDQLGRPVEQILGQGGTTKHQRRYRWGINDRLNEIVDSVTGSARFTHDERGYLTGASYSNGTVQLRNPDAVGNLFETKDRSDRFYGKGGRLLKKGSIRYEYDAEGNLIKKITPKGSWHYEWNASGMLEKVVRPDKEEVTFAYDALGRRLWKKFKRTITNFVWDGNVPLHEFKTFDFKEGEADQLITWVFENDGFIPAAKIKNGKEYSIQADHLGTPNRVYDGDGNLVWLSELDSYGRQRVRNGESGVCPFRYQGQYVDVETGLYYNRFRYFDAEEGRYLSQDPIRLWSGVWGLYNYVGDTTSWIDIFGLNLKSYKKTSKKSEETVRNRLEERYGEGFIVFNKPRIYINGEGKKYAVPDFMVINEKSGKIVGIYDAKNGGGGFTKNQNLLNEKGGVFKGSSRNKLVSKDRGPFEIGKESIKIERTNYPYE